MKQVITAVDITTARKAGKTSLALPAGSIVTPQAMDDAREYGISLVRAGESPAVPGPSVPSGIPSAPPGVKSAALPTFPVRPTPVGNPALVPGAARAARVPSSLPMHTAQSAHSTARVAAAPARTPPPPEVAQEVRRRVMDRLGTAPPTLDAVISSVLAGKPEGVDGTSHGNGPGGIVVGSVAALDSASVTAAAPGAVTMVEVAPSGPSMPGLGYMRWENASFAWTFDQAQALVVLQGNLGLTCGGGEVTAGPGDSLLIPAGASVTLTARGRVCCVHSSWTNPEPV